MKSLTIKKKKCRAICTGKFISCVHLDEGTRGSAGARGWHPGSSTPSQGHLCPQYGRLLRLGHLFHLLWGIPRAGDVQRGFTRRRDGGQVWPVGTEYLHFFYFYF